MKTTTAFLAWMAAAANAHMIMKTPTPAGTPDSSPLLADGSDYPCKGIGAAVGQGPVNTMAVGSSQTLSFTGSAVHGGGSCQVSIAEGTSPDKNTKFMVIHSIEGGCPADVAGNLPADPTGSGAATFQFSIPDHPDIAPGKEYTLAWTWNNKIGNREFYMNCARVAVTAPTKKRYAPSKMPVSKRQQAPLPAMFVANIGNGCSVAEGIDVRYPAPGASLETASDAKLGDPTGSCGAVGAAQPPSGSSASSPAGPATSAPVSNSVSPVDTAGPSKPTGNSGQYTQSAPGVFATVSTGASSPAATESPVASSAAPAIPATSASPATPATSAVAPVGTGTGSAPSTGTCEAGAWDCAADGKSFTRCVAGGTWSAPIQMAAGMTCTPGVSMNFAYNASVGTHAKRDMRSHISKRRSNVHAPALS